MHHSIGGTTEASQIIRIDPEMAAKTHLDNVLQCRDRRMVWVMLISEIRSLLAFLAVKHSYDHKAATAMSIEHSDALIPQKHTYSRTETAFTHCSINSAFSVSVVIFRNFQFNFSRVFSFSLNFS